LASVSTELGLILSHFASFLLKMGKLLLLSLLAASLESVLAGWDSPEYKNFYNVPLPIAPIKQPKA
tara:strand:- start:1171 stop:1368 length:198 start_codon:yes stop_codon:yes gene_type:complete